MTLGQRDRLLASHALVAVVIWFAFAVDLGGALRLEAIFVLVVGVAAALSIGWVAAALLGYPVRHLARSAHRVAAGEPTSLPVTEPGELGTLARAIADLAEQTREQLAQRNRLAALVESMADGLLVLGRSGRVVLANPAAGRILGMSGLLVGRTVAEVMRHPEARIALDRAIGDGSAADVELDAVAGRAAVQLSVRPLSDLAGGGAFAVIHDVTRLRRLETVRRDFVANVSHELRTPVASIQSYAETLLDGALDDPGNARRFVEVIHRNAGRIGRLVADLLQLSRLEARAPGEVPRDRVTLAEIAAAVCDTVEERAGRAGMTVTVEVPQDLEAVGDPDGIEQVVLNLVDNALRYGKAGGRVWIRAAAEADRVRIEIADDGPGIESRHLPRIFERFYRIDAGRSAETGGTGLGLAIVKHLSESMGGSVEVASSLGRGSTFTVRLPAAR